MKKIFLSMLAIAATMNLFAITYAAKATVQLKSNAGYTCNMTIYQSDELIDGVNPGEYAEINMEGRHVALYAMYGGTNYQIFGTKTLGGLPFGIVTYNDTEYQLIVKSVEGTETLTLVDEVAGTNFDLVANAVYDFTATANSTIEDRFHLYVAPSAPEICHRYGKLQVSGSNGQSVAVKNMDDSATSIGTVAITADYQEIDLAGLAAGQYKVEWNSQTLIIDVK